MGSLFYLYLPVYYFLSWKEKIRDDRLVVYLYPVNELIMLCR